MHNGIAVWGKWLISRTMLPRSIYGGAGREGNYRGVNEMIAWQPAGRVEH